MKKASILILLILICCLGYGQTYPLQQNVGNTPTTKVKTNALEGKIIITAFTDTSAANSEGYLKNYDGAVIKTTTPINALWYRVLDSAKWVQILPTGGGTGGIRAWLDGGNYNVLADGQGNAVFGTLGKNGIKFTTQAIPRFILDSAGILSETGSTIGIGYDPSNGNRLTQYSGGGGGSGNYLDSFWRVSGIDSNYYRINGVTYAVLDSTGGGGTGWSLTGNAGTTAGTNFLGTTDNISLMFKTNNTQRAIITAAGVFTTSNDAIINKLNIGNGYYSSSSNTLLGYYAGTDYIDGSTNHGTSFTYIGSLSGAYNFGSDNTAIGTNSLQGVFGGSNTTASRNTSVGSGSGGGSGGGGITTAKNNVFLGFNSGGRITSGSSNFFGGNNSGYSVTTGSNNIVIGDSAMYGTVGIAQIGSNNIILGSSAGYHAANISNSFYVNTIKQSSYADDTSKSLLYGKFDASTNNQSLRLNAKRIYLPYLDNGVGTKAVRWSATQGLVLADTTNSGSGVTSFSKTDNWGIISTVTNPTTTPNHTVGVDSSVVASKDWVGDRLDDYLNITTPRTAWQVFGNHTSGSAAPTWGKLNVNSIDATGTLNSSTVLHGDGTWSTPATGVTTVGSISTSTGISGAAIITGNTIQLVAANSSSQAGIITTGSQDFFGNKNFQSGITTTNISGSGLANFDIGARFGNYSVSPVTGQVLISSSGNRWIGFHRTSIGAPNGLDFNIGVSGTANYDLVIQRIPTHINNFDGTEVARFTRANGNVLIGTSTDNASALLNISSTSKGFLPPRMTATQAEAIVSPAEGLMIYSTNGSGSTITSKGWWGYDGTTWVKLN